MTTNSQSSEVLSRFTTQDLVQELQQREGVQAIHIMPYEPFLITSNNEEIKDTGPAILFIVID